MKGYLLNFIKGTLYGIAFLIIIVSIQYLVETWKG